MGSVQSLREQYRLLQLNKKLLDYDIHDFNFGDICKGEVSAQMAAPTALLNVCVCACVCVFVCVCVQKYIRRILSYGGSPTALEDALMVG